MLRLLYRTLTDLAGPPLRFWLNARARRGKEIRARLAERRGIASLARPDGRLAWLHGASIGEILSILPLAGAVEAAGWHVLFTTGTATSAALLAERRPGALHQFAPLDRAGWVRRFLDHWRPDLVVRTESEVWPNTLLEVGRRRVSMVMVNGRLSDRAFAGWKRAPVFARTVMSQFALVLAQSELDRQRFAALGAPNARALGNLKLAVPPLPADLAALSKLRAEIGQRPVWLASSIHPGEDAIVAAAHVEMKHKRPDLLTVVVPRHADKGILMADTMRAAGLDASLRSDGGHIAMDADVHIADTMGELGLFYRLCDVVFMGKSLAVGGGQNPTEPALIGCALILGPDMSNFREIARELMETGAAVQVADAHGLARQALHLLSDVPARKSMAAAGRQMMARHATALDDTLAALSPYLGKAEIR